MNVQTLKDYLDGESIFTEINGVEPFPFLQGVDLTTLDTLLLTKYGQRPVFSGIAEFDVLNCAMLIVLQFKDAWLQYTELSEIPLAHSSSKTIETLEGTENTVEDGDAVHKVAAFNEDTFVDEYGDKTDTETDRVHGYEKTTDRKGYDISDVETLYNISRHSILNRVIYDVGTFLSLSIY